MKDEDRPKVSKVSNSSLARMAGNIAAGMMTGQPVVTPFLLKEVARQSVQLARLIADEVEKP